MSSAIPMGVGAAAGWGSYASGLASNASTAMNIGMMTMGVTAMFMNSRKQVKISTPEYANVKYTARADNIALPRAYGTVRLPTNLVWFGNYFRLKTKKKQSESRIYNSMTGK